MAYNCEIAETLRTAIDQLAFKPTEELTEKRMFGGLGFLLNGKMLVGIRDSHLLVRMSDEEYDRAFEQSNVFPMIKDERLMKNFAWVDPAGFNCDADYRKWLELSLAYVRYRQENPRTKRNMSISR